jgi:hypothetical protein
MPVTTKPASHAATVWSDSFRYQRAGNGDKLLALSCKPEYDKFFKGMIANSFGGIDEQAHIYSFENGFVNGAVVAYSKHFHLIIRPEDVWFSILTQLSFYINANSEQLRDKFVAHSGQKELLAVQMATLKTADYGKLAFDMGKIIQENVIDPELREWMMPAFSTTTKEDEVVASVIMMGSMQQYFKYCFGLRCGLSSVTLLGNRSDWEKMLGRLDKLLTLGNEPSLWHKLLKPVISHFVETFNSPTSWTTKGFWQKIAHHSGNGSGPRYLSGWITAFCFWDEKGKPLYVPGENPPSIFMDMTALIRTTPFLTLSGVRYHRVNTQAIAAGWVSVPVRVDDNGKVHDTRMVAGSVGVKVTSSKENTELDSLQPVTGWWIYESKPKEQLELEEALELQLRGM